MNSIIIETFDAKMLMLINYCGPFGLNGVIYSFYHWAPTMHLWRVVCGRPAVVERGNKASHPDAFPALIIFAKQFSLAPASAH